MDEVAQLRELSPILFTFRPLIIIPSLLYAHMSPSGRACPRQAAQYGDLSL
jgi:hypothetical protein